MTKLYFMGTMLLLMLALPLVSLAQALPSFVAAWGEVRHYDVGDYSELCPTGRALRKRATRKDLLKRYDAVAIDALRRCLVTQREYAKRARIVSDVEVLKLADIRREMKKAERRFVA